VQLAPATVHNYIPTVELKIECTGTGYGNIGIGTGTSNSKVMRSVKYLPGISYRIDKAVKQLRKIFKILAVLS
jgi:hypothetical protein